MYYDCVPDSTWCEDGWFGFEGNCYYFGTDLQDYDSAINICAQKESLLTSISGLDLNNALIRMRASKFTLHTTSIGKASSQSHNQTNPMYSKVMLRKEHSALRHPPI